jgi:type VI secretion system protein
MANRTLFETFNLLEKHPDGLNSNVNSGCVDSILEHLRNILNTRQGNVLIAANYGMPDLTNFPGENFSTAVSELERILKTTIERYEPRLINVRMRYNPEVSDTLTLRFSLSAEIIATYTEQQQAVFFETVITSDGIVEVER